MTKLQNCINIGVINTTQVSSTPYIVLASDYFLSVTTSSGLTTIKLPNSPITGRVFIVKDKTGTSTTYPITITTVNGTVTIDGSTTYYLNVAYKALQFVFDGTGYEVF